MLSATRLAVLFTLLALAAGCQSVGFKDRYGPSPVIDATDARASTDNVVGALTAFAAAAELQLPEPGSPGWFAVTEAGFNYIDEKCDAYITDLFVANREKDKIKGFAVLADKTSSAVMLATGVGKAAMAIVAQSFGFAEGATDLVANSYLYQIEPSRIQLIVHSMRLAYRQGVYQRRKGIVYPSIAYHHIQKYLELCLPQTIEARINDVLGRTTALPDPTALPGGFDVLLVTNSPKTQRDTAGDHDIPVPHTTAPTPEPQQTHTVQVPHGSRNAASVSAADKRGGLPAEVFVSADKCHAIRTALDDLTRATGKSDRDTICARVFRQVAGQADGPACDIN